MISLFPRTGIFFFADLLGRHLTTVDLSLFFFFLPMCRVLLSIVPFGVAVGGGAQATRQPMLGKEGRKMGRFEIFFWTCVSGVAYSDLRANVNPISWTRDLV